jgi:hypothetical protein
MLELLFGIEGRYKLQMRHFMQLNNFNIEVPGMERTDSYHPVFGTGGDPFAETRWELLKKRLSFAWRKLLASPSPVAVQAAPPAPAEPVRVEELALQSPARDTLVAISTAKGK